LPNLIKQLGLILCILNIIGLISGYLDSNGSISVFSIKTLAHLAKSAPVKH